MRNILFAAIVTILGLAACYGDTCACTMVPPTGELIVNISDVNNQPVAGQSVEFRGGDSSSRRFAQTDAAGNARFESEPGIYSVNYYVVGTNYQYAEPSELGNRQVTIVAGQTARVFYKVRRIN